MRAKHIERRKRFEKQAAEVLTKLGAKPLENNPWPCFELQTRVGALRLCVHTSLWCIAEGVETLDDAPWISSRFDDPKAARALVDCNQFSGKWNFHCWRNWSEDFSYGLAVLESQMKRVL